MSLRTLTKDQKGFTIIEVMIVLAIAGLIVLVVFLAVPALQRNSRNTQRKNDVQAFLGALQEYTNNNNGRVPDPLMLDGIIKAYDNANFGYYNKGDIRWNSKDLHVAPLVVPVPANVLAGAGGSLGTIVKPTITEDFIFLWSGGTCEPTGKEVALTGGGVRSIAINYLVETGGLNETDCVEL